MALIRINHNPPRRQLITFGLIWLVFFGVLGFLLLRNNATLGWITLAAAGAVPIIGWIIPAFMRLVYIGMAYAAYPIGFVVSHILVGVVYYLVLTPIGLVMRVFGYDPMQRRFDPQASTYWQPRRSTETDRYFRQF